MFELTDFLLLHDLPNSGSPWYHEDVSSCWCSIATELKKRKQKMTEEEKESAILFGTIPTRIPIGDVIRAKRIGFGRLEQQRIDLVTREERIQWIHKVESAITFLQSYRAGAKQSLDIELYELNEEAREKQVRLDQKYIPREVSESLKTDKKAAQLAKALETLGLTPSDLKKLKG